MEASIFCHPAMFILKAMSCSKGGEGREMDMSVLEVGKGDGKLQGAQDPRSVHNQPFTRSRQMRNMGQLALTSGARTTTDSSSCPEKKGSRSSRTWGICHHEAVALGYNPPTTTSHREAQGALHIMGTLLDKVLYSKVKPWPAGQKNAALSLL